MNADRLLAHYDRIADAPDALPRLRRLILDLAVRGRLVEQDPNDEPASELLTRFKLAKTEQKRKTGDTRIKPAFPIWIISFVGPNAVFSCKIKVLASPCHHLARGPNG